MLSTEHPLCRNQSSFFKFLQLLLCRRPWAALPSTARRRCSLFASLLAPIDHLILPGIARKHLIAACGRLGIPVLEEPYTLEKLREADEILISSAGSPALVAKAPDGEQVGGKAPALLKKIQDEVLREFLEESFYLKRKVLLIKCEFYVEGLDFYFKCGKIIIGYRWALIAKNETYMRKHFTGGSYYEY